MAHELIYGNRQRMSVRGTDQLMTGPFNQELRESEKDAWNQITFGNEEFLLEASHRDGELLLGLGHSKKSTEQDIVLKSREQQVTRTSRYESGNLEPSDEAVLRNLDQLVEKMIDNLSVASDDYCYDPTPLECHQADAKKEQFDGSRIGCDNPTMHVNEQLRHSRSVNVSHYVEDMCPMLDGKVRSFRKVETALSNADTIIGPPIRQNEPIRTTNNTGCEKIIDCTEATLRMEFPRSRSHVNYRHITKSFVPILEDKRHNLLDNSVSELSSNTRSSQSYAEVFVPVKTSSSQFYSMWNSPCVNSEEFKTERPETSANQSYVNEAKSKTEFNGVPDGVHIDCASSNSVNSTKHIYDKALYSQCVAEEIFQTDKCKYAMVWRDNLNKKPVDLTLSDPYVGFMTEQEKHQIMSNQAAMIKPLLQERNYFCQKIQGEDHIHTQSSSKSLLHENQFLKLHKDVLGVRSFCPANVLSPRKSVEAYIPANFRPRWKEEVDFIREIALYNNLLYNFEKVEKNMSDEKKNARNPEFVNLCLSRAQTLDIVWNIVQETTNFVRILSNRGGKDLICQMLSMHGEKITYKLLGMILNQFQYFASLPLNNADISNYYGVFRKIILTGSSSDFLQMRICSMKRYQLKSMASSQIGLTILLALLHQVEKIIYNNCTPKTYSLHVKVVEDWYESAKNIVTAIICQHRQQSLPVPYEMFGNVVDHVIRYSENGKDVNAFVELFRRWTIVGVPMIHGNFFFAV